MQKKIFTYKEEKKNAQSKAKLNPLGKDCIKTSGKRYPRGPGQGKEVNHKKKGAGEPEHKVKQRLLA